MVGGRLQLGYRHAHEFIATQTRTLQKHGRVSEKATPEAFAMLWTGLLDGLVLLALLDPDRIDPEALGSQVVELLWNGMKRRYGGL